MANNFTEKGKSGLNYSFGCIDEEWLNDFKGTTGVKKIKQMRDNDAIIGAIRFTLTTLISQVDWMVKPASDSTKDKEIAEFVESCMHDMSSSWYNTILDILSFLDFGWSFHEIVYKRRMGRNKDGSKNSKYNDGKIGWRKLPIRAQETLDMWEIDPNGGIQGMYQIAPPDYTRHFIPIEKALHFTTQRHKGNPEGRSLYRNAYKSWYYKKNIQELEGIGVERDLAGLPIIKVPPELLSKNATQDQQSYLASLKKLVMRVRRNESEGIVFPNDVDREGRSTGYKFELLQSTSRRQFSTGEIITRYNKEIAMSVMASFLLMGLEGTGTYNLSKTISELFLVAISTYLDQISEVFNTHAIPRLIDLNGFTGFTEYPELKAGEIKSNIEPLTDLITAVRGTGIDFSDVETQNHIRQMAGLPTLDKNQIEDMKDSNDKDLKDNGNYSENKE
jgi:hypothetical protein